MAPSVTYLGHLIDAAGLHPLPEKVRAIQEVPTPRNVSELKSYLGLFDILFKVPTQPFHKVGSAEQAVESKGQVGMETPAGGSLPGIKEAPGLLPTASTF